MIPSICRFIRSGLTEWARKSSTEVFARNLKQVLLMAPQKGERIMGIDPGFTNGCKFAVISETADVLDTGVIYPHVRNTNPDACVDKLVETLNKHK